MKSERYPVLIRTMYELEPATSEEIERIANRIDRELGAGTRRRRVERPGGVRPESIALAAAAIGMDHLDPAFRRLRPRLRGTLHLTA